MGKNKDSYYYEIHISYEIPYNVLESEDPEISEARNILYGKLKSIIPEDYEKFSAELVMYQLRDSLNYLVTYTTFLRSQGTLPMEDYVGASELKEKIEKELEDFFGIIDCEYKKINIKYFY